MICPVVFGNGELLIGHINPDHLARRPDQLGQRIDIAPRPAAKIKYPATFKQRRTDQTATIIATEDFGVNILEQGFQPARGGRGITAGIGLEVITALKLTAIIIFYSFMHCLFSSSGVFIDEA